MTAALAEPDDLDSWLAQRTEGWPPEQVAMLSAEVRVRQMDLLRNAYRHQPVRWTRERAKSVLWSKQKETLRAVTVHTRVAVQSCHGAGKSFTAADLAAWWIDSHDPGAAFVVSTAPTFAQVRAVLWREINKLHKRADLPGHVNQTEWHLGGELVAFGRKPADTDTDAFQGIHAAFVLVLIDEACGVPEQLWTAAEAIAVGENDRIVAFGNPDDPAGHFAKVCAEDNPLWHTVHISAFDTPNLTGEPMAGGVPGGLVSRRYVEEAAINWGEDSPLYSSKVLGLFPKVDEFATIRPGDLAACRIGMDLQDHQLVPIQLGVDVGGGGDMTSIRARYGQRAGKSWTALTPESEDVVQLVLAAVLEISLVTSIKVDATGIGWGVINDLRKSLALIGLDHITVVPVNFAEKASDPVRLKNRRAELWWDIGRGYSASHFWDLAQLTDNEAAQLLGPRWHLDVRERIQIEAKEDVIKRTGRSPDDADALLLAFWDPVAGAEMEMPFGAVPTGASTAGR